MEHETILNQREAGGESDSTGVTWKEYKSMTLTSQVADTTYQVPLKHGPCKDVQQYVSAAMIRRICLLFCR